MDVGFYAAKIQVRVMEERRRIQYDYERFSETNRFWCMIDLVGSSNYRLLHGPGKGYVRGETFFTLVREVIRPNSEISLLKEIGDAVLLSAASLRPLLECLLLVDIVAYQIEKLAVEESFPFRIRGGISYGPVKKLNRAHEDFLGSPLDQLARVLGLRLPDVNLFLHESAVKDHKSVLEEYAEFVHVSPQRMLSDKDSKAMLEPVYYRELRLDRGKAREYEKHFFAWRDQP